MKVLLLGLGRANLPVARYLIGRNDELFLYEDNPDALTPAAQQLLTTHQVAPYAEHDYDLAITSPGFPVHKPIFQKLQARRVPIVDEIEFTFSQLEDPCIIAVTGTNGKSTTVAIISSILTAGGTSNFLGGNIAPGRSFSEALFEPPYDYYVLEVSSFQLMRIAEFRPHIAVATNIAVDHLNWHSSIDEYTAAKQNIFKNQRTSDFAVLNYEDSVLRKFSHEVRARVVFFGLHARDGAWLNSTMNYKRESLFDTTVTSLKGQHNILNILGAIAVAKIIGIANESIEQGIRTFRTLPHRLEEIGTIEGIRYVNNSMCTNESAAIASLKAITEPVIVIAGGKQKGDRAESYLELLTHIAKACVVLGDNAADITSFFEAKNFKRFAVAGSMADAVAKARSFAVAGDTILLNPGYASFDYFTNFEERGEAFKNAVRAR
jgi:UDP-N-acetylmuramoylalanine--D-glutamate ligase